ncbi:MAG: peptidoglycan-binding protein, partial [Desulfobulbia bacterium]
KLSWKEIKRLFSSPEELVFHDCDTGGASSGSPIFMNTENGPVVVGINVGSYEQIVTSSRSKKNQSRTKIIANTAVNASAFNNLTDILRSADVIASKESLKILQSWLKADGFYKGQVDGFFGPLTRKAITSYQTARQLPITGLPTQSLLKNTVTLGQQLPWLEDKKYIKPASSNSSNIKQHRSVKSKAINSTDSQ